MPAHPQGGQERYLARNNRNENELMSEPTAPNPRAKGDTLWRVAIIAIFVIGVLVAIGLPLLNGNWRSVFSAIPVFAFGILIAAIRSIRR